MKNNGSATIQYYSIDECYIIKAEYYQSGIVTVTSGFKTRQDAEKHATLMNLALQTL